MGSISAGRASAPWLCLCCLLAFAGNSQSLRASQGDFRGLLQDQGGNPLPDVLVALVSSSPALSLPILSRTDERGRVRFINVEAGEYQLRVRSPRYRDPGESAIRIFPGETSIARYVLQQLLPSGAADEINLGVKALLRNSQPERLIFRGLPGHGSGDRLQPFGGDGEALVRVMGGAGLEESHLVFPGDAAAGTTTNFALTQRWLGDAGYVLAGQLNSGEDGLWRLKNFITLPLGDRHSLRVVVGYGRQSFEEPSMALMDHPESLGSETSYTRVPGTTRILTAGFQDEFLLGGALSLLWGLELDRVDADRRYNLLSPNAELTFFPQGKTRVRMVMASKRPSYTGSLELAGGEIVNLEDAAYFSRIGSQVRVGASRYYRTEFIRELTETSRIKVAIFEDQLFEGSTPFLALSDTSPELTVLHLERGQASTRGYQVAFSKRFGDSVRTSLSYVRGSAAGIVSEGEVPEGSDLESIPSLLRRRQHHEIATQVEVYIPLSRTSVNAVVKFLPSGNPVTSLDRFSDTYEVGSKGINLFVRQVVPMPTDWLTFLGLDFLSGYRFEALLDIRNLANQSLSRVQTDLGDILLQRNPRTVRGGISVQF